MRDERRDDGGARRTTRLLSIDVDDIEVAWGDKEQVPIPAGYRPTTPSDVPRTLALLERTNARGTFFVNTQLASPDEGILREIAAAGHELASHGHRHWDVRMRTLDQFREDFLRSMEILSRHQAPVTGYRPPSFTMPYRDDYFRILLDAGIRYVSSGTGVARSNAPAGDSPIMLPCGLLHVPLSMGKVPLLPANYPIGYGVVSRLLPEALYLATLDDWLRKHDYFHYYAHTFEMAGIDRERQIPWRRRWAYASKGIYCLRGRDRTGLFERVLGSARFVPIDTVL